MAELPNIDASVREGTGKGAARAARREGLVPGVVYGGGEDPVAINVKYNELFKRLKAGKFMSTLFNMKLAGEEFRVICRNVQRDVVKDLPTHVDFLRLSRKSRINLFIPVEFIGEEECPGLRAGGTLSVVRNEVELRVTAGNIPDHLTVDLSKLNVGDTITISDIELPEGSRTVITGRDFVIGNLAAPSSLRSADDDSDDTADAADEAADGADASEGEASE